MEAALEYVFGASFKAANLPHILGWRPPSPGTCVKEGHTVSRAMVMQVSHRECPAGMYSSIPFGLAQCSVELPYVFMQCLFFGVISYWMIGFEPSAGMS